VENNKLEIGNLFFNKNKTIRKEKNMLLQENTEDYSANMLYLSVLNQFQDLKDAYKKNLNNTIQKIGKSNKTRVLHSMINSKGGNKCQIGYGSVDFNTLKQIPGIVHMNGNTLNAIVIDLNYINDELTRADLAKKIIKLKNQIDEKIKIQTIIDDLVDFKLEKIDIEIKKTVSEIIDSIDYMKAVDAYYYLFLSKLVKLSYSGKGKDKIFLLGKDIFDIIVERALTGLIIPEERYDEIKIAVNFIFMKQYLNITDANIKTNLIKGFGKELIDSFFEPENYPKIKFSDYDNIYDLAKLLTQKEILNMPPNTLKQRIKNVAGERIEEVLPLNFENFIGYLVSCLYPNQLFNAPVIDKDRQDRLEKLVLNFKSKLII